MSKKPEHFTIHELETLSGFDRRTIAYYIQEGLLPKIGRRGPGTVYPAAFKERLMFIRAVRDLQDAGTLRAVTLAEIRELMVAAETDEIIGWQKADDSALVIRSLFRDPDWDTRKIAVPVEQVTEGVGESSASRSKATSPATKSTSENRRQIDKSAPALKADGTVSQLLDTIEHHCAEKSTRKKTKRQDFSPTPVIQSSVQLTSNISLTANNLDAEHWHLLASLARKLTASK